MSHYLKINRMGSRQSSTSSINLLLTFFQAPLHRLRSLMPVLCILKACRQQACSPESGICLLNLSEPQGLLLLSDLSAWLKEG